MQHIHTTHMGEEDRAKTTKSLESQDRSFRDKAIEKLNRLLL